MGAAMALGSIAAPEAAEALVAALRDESQSVRARAAEALGEVGGSTAAAGLTSALDDPESDVREAAAKALETLKEPRTREPKESRAADRTSPPETHSQPADGAEPTNDQETDAKIRCSVCEGSFGPKEIAREVKLFSARPLDSTTQEWGDGGQTITTTYGEFREHHYPLCAGCSSSRGIKMALGFLPGVVLFFYGIYFILRVVEDATGFDVFLLILFLGGGSAIMAAADRIWGDEKFESVAKRERGKEYEVFTEEKYEELKPTLRIES
jgi:hypothetical protein